jgi:hypothetical protein
MDMLHVHENECKNKNKYMDTDIGTDKDMGNVTDVDTDMDTEMNMEKGSDTKPDTISGIGIMLVYIAVPAFLLDAALL